MAARFAQSLRLFSTNSTKFATIKNAIGGKSLVDEVLVTKNGQLIAAWHPDVDFPYEHSKPIPTFTQAQKSEMIKETALSAASRAFQSKHPEVARQELMKLTHTTKHRWFPRSRDKRAKTTPMDRPYL